MYEKTITFLPKLALVLFCLLAIGYILVLGHALLAPLCFSLLMAMLLLPVSKFLEQKLRLSFTISNIISVLLMVVVVAAVVFFFANQLSSLWQDWPTLKEKANVSYHDLQNWISHTFGVNAQKQLNYLNDSTEKALATSASIVATTLATLSSTALFISFTLLLTFFVLNYRKNLYHFLISVFKDEHKDNVVAIVNQIQFIIKKYILGLFLEMFLVTLLITIGLTIFGVKYAILLGLIAGIFNVVPYIGIFTALLISCLITFATAGAGEILFVLALFIGTHALDANILLPTIVGSKVKINPLIAFIGIVVGEMIWGISGMFLCIPYLAIIKIILDRVDSLKPWGSLMGSEGREAKKIRLPKLKKKPKVEKPSE
ncbi:putative permease [Pedobacter sp. UYP30]|uniref:AI-2E family transporter n=1 Tax=Pedobacter sp. UYP30 TaxID=1756400 RepID=UPI003391EF6C